jgi:hypothetical protein
MKHVHLFLVAAAFCTPAQTQEARHITTEQAIEARVRGFDLTSYRIALLLETAMTQGHMTWDESRAFVAGDPEMIRKISAAWESDQRPPGK